MNRLGSIVFSKATTRLCSKKCDPSKDKASKSDKSKGKGDKKDHCGRSTVPTKPKCNKYPGAKSTTSGGKSSEKCEKNKK
ncbi:uncharacterized protein LOC108023857 [Drosophila biarmipes]|uniref:uncharacterized protein LOC108023857 n=1 Tax=Drosophila biarmipes TaxID=125945 RepID=UPI0007E62FAA|nr:uncharacterized protein LOC108023857 [Drosophila biarmipes]